MHTLRRSLEIDAPPNEVWRVLTTPELVREWAAAYVDGISIRTSWREGERVAWKRPDGGTQAVGTVAAFKPERLLRFDYAAEPGAAEPRSFSDTFEISPGELGTLVRRFNAMASSLEGSRDRLRETADVQSALRRVATLAAGGVPPAEVFTAVAAEAGHVLHADHTEIIRFESGDTARVVGHWSDPGVPQVMPPLGGSPRTQCSSSAWRAASATSGKTTER